MSTRSVRYSTFNRSIRKGNLASTDRDALAFLEAAQIYSANQQRAIVNLVRSLKRVGLWSKMKAIYPFVGGTASAHKWNLKDPRDSDAAFRLTFSGGWTHSADGALPNGTNAYSNTFFVPAGNLTIYQGHLSIYSTTTADADTSERVPIGTGANSSTWNGREVFHIMFQKNRYVVAQHTWSYSSFPTAHAQSTTQTSRGGFWMNNRTSNATTSLQLRRNASVLGTSNQTAGTGEALNNYSVFIGAFRNMTGTSPYSYLYDTTRLAFSSIGDGLTDTDATNLYNIVDLYQKRLGRAV